ncbi:MAG: glycosyltransferase family 2 protein [Anaerolineae bacterium]|nr:glycosyltransferase family 2 protein [Anaerolineae bacterium]MCA9889493.1 glycosyltransferase family 2 protein [Anaerolineae bacterium]MCA9895811.1 glycosyltransferase family 2 protein [Anaerolineae bacterium]
MISVVMPVYNSEKFLRPAVESILNQTFRDFEFIIINDGSTDASPAILQEYAERDSRVRVINTEHIGLVGALNLGIAAAHYEWIARMDADDISLPRRFEKQLEAAEKHPEVVVWGSYIHHINANESILSLSKVGPACPEEYRRCRETHGLIQVIHPSALMRKDVIIKAGGYKAAYESAEDVELFDRMADFGPILALTEPLLLYRVHPNSVSMQKFFIQKQISDYVALRRKCENTGHKPPNLEEFLKDYDTQPAVVRIKRNLGIRRQLYYRSAGMLFGDGQYAKALFYFGLSTLLDPVYSLRRAWNQRPVLRHQLS